MILVGIQQNHMAQNPAAATQTAAGHALCEICVHLGVLPKAKHIN